MPRQATESKALIDDDVRDHSVVTSRMPRKELAEKYASLLIADVCNMQTSMWMEGLISGLGSGKRQAPRRVRVKKMQKRFTVWFSKLQYAVQEMRRAGHSPGWLDEPIVEIQDRPKTPNEMMAYRRAPTKWAFVNTSS